MTSHADANILDVNIVNGNGNGIIEIVFPIIGAIWEFLMGLWNGLTEIILDYALEVGQTELQITIYGAGIIALIILAKANLIGNIMDNWSMYIGAGVVLLIILAFIGVIK